MKQQILRMGLVGLVCLYVSVVRAEAVKDTINCIVYTLHQETLTASVSGHVQCEGHVTLPETITAGDITYVVTEIEAHAFQSAKITGIAIPETVTRLGDYIFNMCSYLEYVTLPEGLTYISDYMFRDCARLQEVVIPEEVTSIGEYAFLGCTSLSRITIPRKVERLVGQAFVFCLRLKEIMVAPENPAFMVKDGVLFSRDGKLLKRFPSGMELNEYIVPDGVEEIEAYAFEQTVIENVRFPESIYEIGRLAFSDCKKLREVDLPANLYTIEEGLFENCVNLRSVFIPEGVGSIGNSSFAYCTRLNRINVPENVVTIGRYAFWHCRHLSCITFGRFMYDIGMYAFSGCEMLKDIYCYPETPIETTYPVGWPSYIYETCTLHVPPGCARDYYMAKGWGGFVHIVDDLTTDVTDPQTDRDEHIRLTGAGLQLGNTPWTVYTTDGRVVARGCKEETLSLPCGLYVVKCGPAVRKIAVK